MARFPMVAKRGLPWEHWRRVIVHLQTRQPNNKQGIRKAQKMLRRALA